MNSKNDLETSALVFGKVPPQAKELEEAVLGAIMLEKNAFSTASEIIRSPEYFYVDAHASIYSAMLQLVAKHSVIDLLTVVEELKRSGKLEEVGGIYYVSKLTNSVSSTAHLKSHCTIVYEKFLLREQIKHASTVIKRAYADDADPFVLLDETEASISGLSVGSKIKTYSHVSELSALTLNDIETKKLQRETAEKEGKEFVVGVNTGFKSINDFTEGWRPTDLIILAARPAVGKTALALNFALNAAESGTPTAFFSLEMGDRQLMQRLLSNKSEIYMDSISKAKLSDEETMKLSFTVGKFENIPLFVDDTASMTINDFRSKARHLVVKEGVRFIIVDYLQLMSGGGKSGNREQEISTISRSLKILAKELNIPVMALSQLSREVEKRKESKMPILSDLRESGAIEQDADVVVFAWRPDAGMTPDEVLSEEQSTGQSIKGKVNLKWAKFRNGSLDLIALKANLGIQKFIDPTEEQPFFEQGSWRPANTYQPGGNSYNSAQEPF